MSSSKPREAVPKVGITKARSKLQAHSTSSTNVAGVKDVLSDLTDASKTLKDGDEVTALAIQQPDMTINLSGDAFPPHVFVPKDDATLLADPHLPQPIVRLAPYRAPNIDQQIAAQAEAKRRLEQEQARQKADAVELERQNHRRQVLADVLRFVSQDHADAQKNWFERAKRVVRSKSFLFKEIRKYTQEFLDEEIRAIIANTQELLANEALRNALVTGGVQIENNNKHRAVVYERKKISAGALGEVMDAFVLLNGKFIEGVVKRPLKTPHIINLFRVEKANAARMQKKIPGVMQTLFISDTTSLDTDMIVYEKITSPAEACITFEDYAKDLRVPPSEKIDAFTDAIEGVANMHAMGITHNDLKPANIMLDKNRRGKVVDFGSFTVHGEKRYLSLDYVDEAGHLSPRMFRTTNIGHGPEEFPVPYSPGLTDLHLLDQAEKMGKSLDVGDRRALGISILHILHFSGVIHMPSLDHVIPYDLKTNFLQQFPPMISDLQSTPWPLFQLIVIVRELMDVTGAKPMRPLHVIIHDVRTLVPALKNELDPLWQRSKNFS